MQLKLEVVDLAIIVAYVIGVLVVGLWLARKDSKGGGEDDFFVAGRNLGWFAVGASLFASNISSEHLIGLAADGFRSGLAVGNYEWGACLVLIVLATVFVPFYVGSGIRTIPEYLERRFGRGARVYLSLLTIVANVLVRISVALYAGSLVMQEMFGFGMWTSIVFLAVVTVAYTAAGGLKAVVYTDALQTVILLFGTILLTWISLDKVGGWSVLTQSLDPSYFDMVRPADDPEMPWPGLLLGVPVLGVWYWCTDQVIVQRVLGAKSIRQARYGALFAAFLKVLPVFLFVLPGLCGRLLFPEADAKAIFPIMVTELLPVGVTGLVSAALIAALMSSIDSTLNSTGTLVAIDFYKPARPKASQAELVRVGRLATLGVMIFGIAWVLVVQRAESLFQYLQQVNAAISPPIAATFLLGIFWKRANHFGVMWGLFVGMGFGIFMTIDGSLSFLIAAGVNFFLSITVILFASGFRPAPARNQTRGLVWTDLSKVLESKTKRGSDSFFRSAVILLLLTMIGLWMAFS